MIRKKSDPPSSYLSTPPPETSPRSSLVVSDWDADDEETMSMEDVRPSRPSSMVMNESSKTSSQQAHRPYSPYPHRPTLPDVLSNSAPPPWTLSAFTAYLSQNHCLENLEFTMDAERYKERFDALAKKMGGKSIGSNAEECRYLRMLWKRLMDAYIIPDGPREINIPSNVRDTLLSISNHAAPPNPEELGDAIKIIYNLMEESVLVSFLNEVPSSRSSKSKSSKPNAAQEVVLRKRGGSDSSTEKKLSRSRSRRRVSPSASLDASYSSSDPTGRLTPAANIPNSFGKGNRAPSHTSSGSGDPGLMTDESGSSPGAGLGEPMTPPGTPPSSDFGGGSPRSRAPDNTWKKMLGWKKKSSNAMRDSRYLAEE